LQGIRFGRHTIFNGPGKSGLKVRQSGKKPLGQAKGFRIYRNPGKKAPGWFPGTKKPFGFSTEKIPEAPQKYPRQPKFNLGNPGKPSRGYKFSLGKTLKTSVQKNFWKGGGWPLRITTGFFCKNQTPGEDFLCFPQKNSGCVNPPLRKGPPHNF